MTEPEPTELAPEYMVPTPDQWIARWNTLTLDEKRQAARRNIEARDQARRCFQENHVALLQEHLERGLHS